MNTQTIKIRKVGGKNAVVSHTGMSTKARLLIVLVIVVLVATLAIMATNKPHATAINTSQSTQLITFQCSDGHTEKAFIMPGQTLDLTAMCEN